MSVLATDFARYDALDLAALIRKGDISALELLDAVIARVHAVNNVLNCMCLPAFEQARKDAQKTLPAGPLSGLPLFLKDLILWHKDTPMSSGSAYLRNYVPPVNSEVVQRLLDAGMIFAGRTLSAEFGALPTVESRYWGTCHNPWNSEYSTGGSSGGAAALVASRIFPLADANDGGGSVRGPASLCGVVGLKPSRGRHSFAPFGNWRFGLGVCGCMSLSVRDSAAYLDVINSADMGTQALATPAGGFLQALRTPSRPLRIGILREPSPRVPVHAECCIALEKTAALCRELGHQVQDALLPEWGSWSERIGIFFQSSGAVWLSLCIAQKIQELGREPLESEMEVITWAAWQKGKSISALEHELDQELMRRLCMHICRQLAPYDVLLTPTLAEPAFRLGYMNPNKDELSQLGTSACAKSWIAFGYYLTLLNATGLPALSLPLHWTKDNMPVGVQLIGRHAEEHLLLGLASQLEQAKPWMQRLPPVHP